MKVDSYINSLLAQWGREWFSEDLDYPHLCPYLKEYRPKGYKEEPHNMDRPEVERLAEWMPVNLGRIRIDVLRTRYRKQIRHKRRAARFMGISEDKYRQYFNDAIRTIEARF